MRYSRHSPGKEIAVGVKREKPVGSTGLIGVKPQHVGGLRSSGP